MKNADIEAHLFRDAAHQAQYGDKYVDHLLEQYKVYLSMLDKISERRQKSNEFFMGLNTAVIGLWGYIEAKRLGPATLVLLAIPLFGWVISFFWYQIIRSYKNLNTVKFEIVHVMEQRLPMVVFETEWLLAGKGKDKKRYYPFTHIELKIPLLFIGIFALLFFAAVPWHEIVSLLLKWF